MSAGTTIDSPILVLILDADARRIKTMAGTISKAVQCKILTCNNPLGCFEMARKNKPQIVFIHSSEAMVENVSLVDLIRALSPQSIVQMFH
jgi:hypothetical protein